MTERRRGLGRGLGALLPAARLAEDEVDGADRASLVAVGASYGTAGVDLAPAPAAATEGGGVPDPTVEATGGPAAERPVEVPVDVTGGPAAERAIEDPVEVIGEPAAIGARFAELPVDAIRANPRQPRQVFDEDELAELVHSIREIGVLQPVVVRELPREEGDGFELVMGERRWRAARAAGLVTVPAIIRDTPDTAMLRDALLENLHRAQLNPLEEAAAYDQLLQDFGCTQEQLAERIGRSRPQISNTLRLLRLPPSVQRRLAAGVLSAGHARALLSLPEAAAQERLAQRVVAEGLSVRSVEEIVAVGGTEAVGRGPAVRTRTAATPAMADLAERVASALDTRVRVDLGRTKGKLVIEFASAADLERIVTLVTGSPAGAAVEMST